MLQDDSIRIAQDEISKFMLTNVGKKYKILIGTYLIGKFGLL